MKSIVLLIISFSLLFTMFVFAADTEPVNFSNTGTKPCSVTINQDLSFTIPNAIYHGGPLVGQMALKIDFQFFGEQNGQLFWQSGDVDSYLLSVSCPISIAPDLSFTLTDAVYDGGPLVGQMTLQADFQYTGEQNGALLWFLADLKVDDAPLDPPPDPPSSNCGAYVAPGVWKAFDCYNLAAIGKTTKDDPFTPSWRLIGGYWQWGRKGPDSSKWYGENTESFAHGPTGPDAGNANDAGIKEGWDQTTAPDGSWHDASKTAHDPCPDGFRVPTASQWDGVRDNNTQSAIGTWLSKATNYSSAWFFGSDLMLPAAGYRNYSGNGGLNDRGGSGSYWSSSEISDGSAWLLYIYSSGVDANINDRREGFSVRCIKDAASSQPDDLALGKNVVSLVPGGKETVAVSGKYESFTVITSDSKVAMVTMTQNGINIEGVSPGTATVTVKDNNGRTATLILEILGSITLPFHCGAFVAPGIWKEFDCYNLAAIGKTTNDDPFIPSWRLIGGYWQWGRKGPDPGSWYDTNTPHFTHGPIGSGLDEANEGEFIGWNHTDIPDGAWSDNYKTLNDPCPEGFRVPTQSEWDGVLSLNPQNTVGSPWTSSATNYSSARFFGDDLMLPTAGYRFDYDGILHSRDFSGFYWSSSQNSYDLWYLNFFPDYAETDSLPPSTSGFSVRCIAEESSMCTYSIFPSSDILNADGGTNTVVVTASGPACSWSASESLSWVSLSPPGRTGSGSVIITVFPNNGYARSGSVIIAGNLYTINQAGRPSHLTDNCGAFVAPGVWKQFDCYNLAAIGKISYDDPFSPSWRLIGGYWQWGKKGPDPSQWHDTNTPHFAHGPTGPNADSANDGDVAEWDSIVAPNYYFWLDTTKTVNDPCPAGYRVPTKAQWDGVLDNNPQRTKGTWSSSWDDYTNYSAARYFGSALMLPAAGRRYDSGSGALYYRGFDGGYWSSSVSSSNLAWLLYFSSGIADTIEYYRLSGLSVRCVAE